MAILASTHASNGQPPIHVASETESVSDAVNGVTNAASRTGYFSNQRWMSACMMNCQSVGNKALTIKDYVVDHDMDCVFLCETWLTSSRQRICGDLTPTGYKLRALNRKGKRGGGVAVLHKSNILVEDVVDLTTSSMEGLGVTIAASKRFRMILLYRLKLSVNNPCFPQ